MSDIEILNCPDSDCGNKGWYVEPNHFTGEPEQVQCEFCYTEENSVFSVVESLKAKVSALEKITSKIDAYKLQRNDYGKAVKERDVRISALEEENKALKAFWEDYNKYGEITWESALKYQEYLPAPPK